MCKIPHYLTRVFSPQFILTKSNGTMRRNINSMYICPSSTSLLCIPAVSSQRQASTPTRGGIRKHQPFRLQSHHLFFRRCSLSFLWVSAKASPREPSSDFFPHALPSNQSVTLITLVVLSQLPPSSACSIVWLRIRPSSSNSNMKSPQNSSSSRAAPLRNSVILSTCSPADIPRYKLLICLPLLLPHVFHRTISFS
jgi:hypothetical protein